MATLNELMAEYGLSDSSPAQEKTAAAKTATTEVEQVLEDLGLTGAADGIDKVANETNQKGERMSLTDIYDSLFDQGTETSETTEEGTEKTASSEEGNEATELFGELTARYFGVAHGTYLDKVAGSVEDESDQDDEQPMKNLGNQGSLTTTIGKPADPALPVNHSASGGGAMQTMTGNSSPYSLKELAFIKSVLKRVGKSEAGAVGAYKD
jgi:hypothetical protein